MNLEFICYGAIVVGGLIVLLKLVSFSPEERSNDNPDSSDSGANLDGEPEEIPVPTGTPVTTKPVAVASLPFQYPPAVDFWQREIVARDIGEPYRSIITELLIILCSEAEQFPSVAGNFRSSTSSTYSRVGKTSLLDHSLHVAEEFCKQGNRSHITALGVIASLGHDLGKLPNRRTGRYQSFNHPKWSAQIVRPSLEKYLDRSDGLPALSPQEQNEILTTIELHHQDGEGLLLSRLKKADMAARNKEEIAGALNDAPHA